MEQLTWALSTSRLALGSSATMTAGRATIARAIATRCACPTESSRDLRRGSTAPSPISASFSCASSTHSSLLRRSPRARNGSARQRQIGHRGDRLPTGFWNTGITKPAGRRCTAPVSGRNSTLPAWGCSNPASNRSSVDLPQPLGPWTPNT